MDIPFIRQQNKLLSFYNVGIPSIMPPKHRLRGHRPRRQKRALTRGKNEGMAEKGSMDTKQDGHDCNPRTGLVVWKVLYTQNLTSIK